MNKLKWTDPAPGTEIPLWRIVLAMYAECYEYKQVAKLLEEKFGITVSASTVRQQIQEYGTPELRRQEPSRRQIRFWLIEFLGLHGIRMDEWIRFAAQREAEDNART